MIQKTKEDATFIPLFRKRTFEKVIFMIYIFASLVKTSDETFKSWVSPSKNLRKLFVVLSECIAKFAICWRCFHISFYETCTVSVNLFRCLNVVRFKLLNGKLWLMMQTTRRTPSGDFKKAKQELIFSVHECIIDTVSTRVHKQLVYALSLPRENVANRNVYIVTGTFCKRCWRTHACAYATYVFKCEIGDVFVPSSSTERQHHHRRLPDAP